MGVLNVTPDSFSDGGRWLDPDKAVEHGLEMHRAGADVIDVGGESTRPGAASVSVEEELRRVIPVIEALAQQVRVSIDTTKSEVAVAAVEAGATCINDVSASLYQVAADTGTIWVGMHMLGEPRTMQDAPQYDDVVKEVSEFLFERASLAESAGVREVWIDPGIGFGKTLHHNLLLLHHLDVLTRSPYPVLIGTSRKSFLGKLTDTPDADDRLEASIASAVWAVSKGASMLRVHDVSETIRAVRVVSSIMNVT